jgi:hypothetical protein
VIADCGGESVALVLLTVPDRDRERRTPRGCRAGGDDGRSPILTGTEVESDEVSEKKGSGNEASWCASSDRGRLRK